MPTSSLQPSRAGRDLMHLFEKAIHLVCLLLNLPYCLFVDKPKFRNWESSWTDVLCSCEFSMKPAACARGCHCGPPCLSHWWHECIYQTLCERAGAMDGRCFQAIEVWAVVRVCALRGGCRVVVQVIPGSRGFWSSQDSPRISVNWISQYASCTHIYPDGSSSCPSEPECWGRLFQFLGENV